VNKALLYYYFKSKEDLYAAVVEDYFREFNSRALEVLNSKGPAQEILLRYVSLHMDFISRKQQSAPLFQQLTMDNQRFLKRLIPKYFRARSQAMDNLLKRGMRSGEFRKVDRFQAAVSIVSLIVFYFSAARVLKLLGRKDAYNKTNLKRRKQQVLDFIRHGLFTTAD
jgi:TetR/AcrR family transcriptional regulator